MAVPSRNLQEIVEYRGVEGLVAAEVLADDGDNYTTGDVFAIAGVAEISKTTDSSNEAHYYDNMPAVVVSNTSSDEVTISASAIPFDVLATITGQYYDEETGGFVEGTRDFKYFAIGYKTKKTNGDEVYVWRYKGTFNIPNQTNSTENDSTDANGQEIVYTGISTTHKFTNNPDRNGNPRGAKALCVDVAKDLADVSEFFDTVVTPDTLQPKTPATMYAITNTLTHCTTNNTATSIVSGGAYAATITAAEGYTLGTVTVTMGGTDISSTAVSGGAITVPAVTGALVITATATEN
ncbi:MAG: hypothetical protein IIV15_01175 [Ruminococcus sp.]|nr:hypothetical protein [Ruminococcus sp.]MBQ5629894.1 hypothetical protein [Ruminococcus sp.]